MPVGRVSGHGFSGYGSSYTGRQATQAGLSKDESDRTTRDERRAVGAHRCRGSRDFVSIASSISNRSGGHSDPEQKKPTFDCTGQNDPNPAVEGRWWLSFDDCSEVLERSLAKATGSNQQRGTKLDSIGILDRGEKTSTSCRVVTGASGTWHAEFWLGSSRATG